MGYYTEILWYSIIFILDDSYLNISPLNTECIGSNWNWMINGMKWRARAREREIKAHRKNNTFLFHADVIVVALDCCSNHFTTEYIHSCYLSFPLTCRYSRSHPSLKRKSHLYYEVETQASALEWWYSRNENYKHRKLVSK